MTRKHYVVMAEIVGRTLATAESEEARTRIYDALYEPFVSLAKRDNANFDRSRFEYAVEKAEQNEEAS